MKLCSQKNIMFSVLYVIKSAEVKNKLLKKRESESARAREKPREKETETDRHFLPSPHKTSS